MPPKRRFMNKSTQYILLFLNNVNRFYFYYSTKDGSNINPKHTRCSVKPRFH